MIKRKISRFSQRYGTELRKHLKQGLLASLRPALELGRVAVALGLETLELARIHEQALATLESSNYKNGFITLAGDFFIQANTPIEETHQAARQAGAGRKDAAGKNGKPPEKCLEESLQLQDHLRELTHRVLAAQEDERKRISCELQDEIAQTLLGVNVRLLTLKTAARDNAGNLTKEIANTQNLVIESIQSINRFARELNVISKQHKFPAEFVIGPVRHP